jgi:hypothetical protein
MLSIISGWSSILEAYSLSNRLWRTTCLVDLRTDYQPFAGMAAATASSSKCTGCYASSQYIADSIDCRAALQV